MNNILLIVKRLEAKGFTISDIEWVLGINWDDINKMIELLP